MVYKGSCHCKKISYEVEGDILEVIECNCSICTKRGYLLWFIPREKLHLRTPADIILSTYTFNTHRIKHHFCSTCGCAPFGEGEMKGVAMAAVNVRCLDNVDLDQVKRVPFNGRSL